MSKTFNADWGIGGEYGIDINALLFDFLLLLTGLAVVGDMFRDEFLLKRLHCLLCCEIGEDFEDILLVGDASDDDKVAVFKLHFSVPSALAMAALAT